MHKCTVPILDLWCSKVGGLTFENKKNNLTVAVAQLGIRVYDNTNDAFIGTAILGLWDKLV